MLGKLDGCEELTSGARFYRGDLHVHSFGASHDVNDPEMTPEAIVRTAAQENLSIVAIADHNEISNVQAALDVAEELGILVVPAIELSTPEGHLLCYFETIEALSAFHGRLKIVERHTQTSRCQNGMHDCLNIAKSLGGFGILAHVDAGSGLETKLPGATPHKQDIISHEALLGIELKDSKSEVSYSKSDPDRARQGMGEKRISSLGLGERQYLARILNSDSHTLNALGRNAINDRKLTRYKMASPSFQSLRHALEEGDSRIRLENEIPNSTPFILGVALDGGYLSGQTIHFSQNLNCIIGGRGTGKSTTFEAVRCLTGTDSGAAVVDSSVWPNQLHLFWQDEAGTKHSLLRSMGKPLLNIDDPIDGPISFEIDCFGQGEAASVREQAKSNPLTLLNYLDRFTNAEELLKEEALALKEIKAHQQKMIKATENISEIPNAQRALTVVQQQIQAFQSANGAEVIKLQRNLASEQSKKESIEEFTNEIVVLLDDSVVEELIRRAKETLATGDIVNGALEADNIDTALSEFEAEFAAAKITLSNKYRELRHTVDASISAWTEKEKPIREDIENKRAALELKGVRLDMSHITRLTSEESRLAKNLDDLKTWQPHLKQLETTYNTMLESRRKARTSVARRRQNYAVTATRALGEVLSEFQVKLQYAESSHSDESVHLINKEMGWRSGNKAKLLVEQLTTPKLIDAISKSNWSAITAIKLQDEIQQFSEAEAKSIIETFKKPTSLFKLQACHVDDLPRLTVSKQVNNSGNIRNLQREFAELSLGQQQSVLLALILSSESTRPLIIDQPEDNLDSEFIFHTFVPVLRRAKERRQVIIITHNANIAVLGDAEQLVVLKSNNDKSIIAARGSIDDIEARDAACKILEGAKEAFTRRARIYGIR